MPTAAEVYEVVFEPLPDVRTRRLGNIASAVAAVAGGAEEPLMFAVEDAVIYRRRDGAEVGRHRAVGVTRSVVQEQLQITDAAEFARIWCADETP